MKTLNTLFKAASWLALTGWLILVTALFFKPYSFYAVSIVTASSVIVLCILYLYLLLAGRQHNPLDIKESGHFWSLKGVLKLFESPRMVLAGWVHYLAFDLFIGAFIVANSNYHAIPPLLVLPCLSLALLFGPTGLLAYFLLRFYITGDWLSLNF